MLIILPRTCATYGLPRPQIHLTCSHKRNTSESMNYAAVIRGSIMDDWSRCTHSPSPLESATMRAAPRCSAAPRSALYTESLHGLLLAFDAFDPFHTCCKYPRTHIVKARALVHGSHVDTNLTCNLRGGNNARSQLGIEASFTHGKIHTSMKNAYEIMNFSAPKFFRAHTLREWRKTVKISSSEKHRRRLDDSCNRKAAPTKHALMQLK